MTTMLKIKEIAESLRVSTVTVRRWIQTGLLPGIAVGSTYRVSTTEMERFLSANQTDNTVFGDVEDLENGESNV